MAVTLQQLDTPCLLLERGRLERNCARLRERITGLGAALRPHLKTCKSWPAAAIMLAGGAAATVSTLREAEEFAACGVRDLIYAVGIAPQKLDRVGRLRAAGADLAVILDSREQAAALAARAAAGAAPIPALVEIDADGHRAGIRPDQPERLLAVARALPAGALRGVLTHAGASYQAQGRAALEQAAEGERAAAVAAAACLRAAGFACPVVSVGSTPTAHFARSLAGVTEVRAGVYCFFDLVMAGLGVCGREDIACTVLATVIGHQPDQPAPGGWTLTDAGWMALSRDRGDGRCGYGLVADLRGAPLGELRVTDTSQEHGVLALPPGSRQAPPQLAVGTRVRILPNHICATAAQFDRYFVVDGGETVIAEWPRFHGW